MTNSDKIILRFIITGLLISPFLLFAQENKKWYNGVGIEEGIGYNTATLEHKYTIPMLGTYDDFEHKTAFWVQPSVRIFYSIALHSFSENKKIKMPIFISYYSFGGKTKNNGSWGTPDMYQPTTIIDLFRSVEVGINPCIEKNKFQFGLLLKGQYIFSATERMYMVNIVNPPYWKETDVSNDYKKFAMNTGIKFKWKIIKGFSIAGEAWFGITNLQSYFNNTNENKLRVTENNYRLLLGYEF
jgi:hypothetical protein